MCKSETLNMKIPCLLINVKIVLRKERLEKYLVDLHEASAFTAQIIWQ